jgi:hypothetical protein
VGYWDPIRAEINKQQLPAISLTLLWISLGFSAAWAHRDIVGWIPFILSLFYSFSTAIGRYSGWRLILPADWVIFLYFAIGIGQITIWFFSLYGLPIQPVSSFLQGDSTWQRVRQSPPGTIFPLSSGFLAIGILLIFGMMPIIVEAAVPQRYTQNEPQNLLEEVVVVQKPIAQVLIDGGVVLQGRALYPRFMKAGEGEPGNGWPAFTSREYDRLGFVLISESGKYNVILPMDEPPDYFPNASDVIVVGCQQDDILAGGIVQFVRDPALVYVKPGFLDVMGCPNQIR